MSTATAAEAAAATATAASTGEGRRGQRQRYAQRTRDEAIEELVFHRNSSVLERFKRRLPAARRPPAEPKRPPISTDKGDRF
jgi:hypothetical protein